MKKGLSWIPLASGSEAIEGATGAGLAPTRKRATATKAHDFDFVLRAENCRCFMAGEVLPQSFRRNRTKSRNIGKRIRIRLQPFSIGKRLNLPGLIVGLP